MAIREDEPRMDKESQERVKREQETQQVLKAQLEDLVGALKASSLLVHSSLREQNKVSEWVGWWVGRAGMVAVAVCVPAARGRGRRGGGGCVLLCCYRV